jgi:hypothetical protein
MSNSGEKQPIHTKLNCVMEVYREICYIKSFSYCSREAVSIESR